MADKIKLSIALLVLIGAVGAFYYYSEYSQLYRALGLVAAAGIALAIAAQSEIGRAALRFLRESRTEVRKVVWPNRKETAQTTLIVLIMVLIVGIFLWLLDMVLLQGVKLLTGQGG